jgi:hypothetical protein
MDVLLLKPEIRSFRADDPDHAHYVQILKFIILRKADVSCLGEALTLRAVNELVGVGAGFVNLTVISI